MRAMQITAVEAFLMSCPLPAPLRLPFRNGERTILKRDAMYIRITTDGGLRGYAPGPADERAAQLIRHEIAAFLRGRDPLQWRTFALRGSDAVEKVYAAVEIALMDLQARHEGCPLSEIVGGRVRQEIKLYGSAGMYMPPAGYAEEAVAVQAMGFPAYKMRPARGPNDDVESVARMREAMASAPSYS